VGRPKSLENLSKSPVATRITDPFRLRLKELTNRHTDNQTLNALLAEILFYFLKEKPYEKELKFQIPGSLIEQKERQPVRTNWNNFNVFLPHGLKEELKEEIKRIHSAGDLSVSSARFVYTAIFWWLNAVEPENNQTQKTNIYNDLKKIHGAFGEASKKQNSTEEDIHPPGEEKGGKTGRRKSFEDLSKTPVVTRVLDSDRRRLKELADQPDRKTLNALMTEIMTYFLLEKPYQKGLKFRIPRFTIVIENGQPIQTGWKKLNVYLPSPLKDKMIAETERIRTEERIHITPAHFTFSAIFWWLTLVEPEGEETRTYYDSLKKIHGEWKRGEE
jgi:hypothetical protein